MLIEHRITVSAAPDIGHDLVSLRNPGGVIQRSRLLSEIKEIFQTFLTRLDYRPPRTAANAQLRAEITAEVESWNAKLLTPAFVESVIDASCSMAESTYAHLPYKHQLLIATYSLYVLYVDDLGQRNVDALGQIGRWLVAREEVTDPVLKRLVLQFDQMHEYYPTLGADLINASTFEGIIGRYMECAADKTGAVVDSGTTLYAAFLRLKTGFGAASALFNFVRGWRSPDDHRYLQLVPAMEQYFNAINLSFYKEMLDGETDNYVHLRAAAEDKDPLTIIRELVEETLDNVRDIERLVSSDAELARICRSHLMGYVEFTLRAKRYRLRELDLEI
ncbi:hypothetical protein BN946_scf184915.g47 [Trametes cinnabarina]|uniref:Terpene synthase n=1 Tax=Pycnoporus cinnabarinus TaxID=5643 RepID=A0A060SH14_PYCCI|nr:hypothetical protein BN946_scf184915.g47 [Trametes cinnabarina]